MAVRPRFDPWARRRARRLLLQALYQWQVSRLDAAEVERQFAADNDFNRMDQTFFHDVLRGVEREHEALDAALAPYLDRRPDELDQIERALLRMGAYELRHRMDVPYRVVIDECVSLAKTFGAEEGHKYVNGVLDKLARRERAMEFGRAGQQPE